MSIVLCEDCWKKLIEISKRDYEVKTIGHVYGNCYFCNKELPFLSKGKML